MSSDLSKPAMELPPEVLGRILTCLEKKDLKEVRLVCKKLERSAVSLLFDEVYLSAHPADLEVAQTTVRNFGKSIKTVLFSAVEYPEIKWGLFKSLMRPSRKEIEYVRLAYTNYCRLRQEQQEMYQAGTYFGHLCYALRTVPSAQRLVLTHFEDHWSDFGWERRLSRLWRVGDCPAHCSFQGCAYGNLMHLSYMLEPRGQLHERRTRRTNPWSLVMTGLAATGSRIRELEMDSSYEGYVPHGGFENTLQQPFELRDIFQHFRKLRLNFNPPLENVAPTLSTATKLKSLCINVDGYGPRGPTIFKEIIGECEFPQLRSLILEGFTSTEAELLDFLHCSSHLQQLTLTNHRLGCGNNWESCTNGIKLALPTLKHIIVHALTSNFGGHSPIRHTQHCRRTEVQGFFFQGKENPFACAQGQDERTRVTFLITDDNNRPLGGEFRNELWMTSFREFH